MRFETNVPEDEQESSFMNSTLQSVGHDSKLAFSIMTELSIPKDVASKGDDAVVKYINSKLQSAEDQITGLAFSVQIGPCRE